MGLDDLGYGGNGDYALEQVASGTTSLKSQLAATFNGSSPSTGFLGLGIRPQNLGGVVQKSPITRLVEESGLAPSYSYGFTAGAKYSEFRVHTFIPAKSDHSSGHQWHTIIFSDRRLRPEQI